MENFQLINNIQAAVVLIDSDKTVIDINNAYQQRNNIKNCIGKKCFNCAYQFEESCSDKFSKPCPLDESFKTKKISSTIHHYWIKGQAVVEEITTTPILDKNGSVNYVVEEFRDITRLLGLNKGIITLCSYCRKIRDQDQQWVVFESYIRRHTGANFSHGICDECKLSLTRTNQT